MRPCTWILSLLLLLGSGIWTGPSGWPLLAAQSVTATASACPDPADPAVRYVSRDAAACAAVRFTCQGDEVLFSNHCGCGCLGARASETTDCVVPPQGNCTTDSNGCGQPSRCQCPDQFTYSPSRGAGVKAP